MSKKLIAVLLGTSMLALPAISLAKNASKTDPVVTASQSADKKADEDFAKLMKLSENGNRALRDVRAARIAIFNGNPEASKRFVDQSLTDIAAARKEDAASYKGRTGGTGDDDVWLPVDSSIGITDDFVSSKEKTAHIAKANNHLKKGNKKQAVDELKLAEVGVAYTRVMLPLQATEDHVKVAQGLLGEHKYYEANLALKAAEDGAFVDTVALADAPRTATGTNAKTAQNSGKNGQKPAASTAKQ